MCGGGGGGGRGAQAASRLVCTKALGQIREVDCVGEWGWVS